MSYPHRCGKVENFSDFSDFFDIKVEKQGIFNEFLSCKCGFLCGKVVYLLKSPSFPQLVVVEKYWLYKKRTKSLK